jgi:hypothetical protein
MQEKADCISLGEHCAQGRERQQLPFDRYEPHDPLARDRLFQ